MGVRIREKLPGEWWIFINHNGQRRSKKIGPKREAQRLAKEVTQKLAAGELGLLNDQDRTFGKYCEKWITKYAPQSCKASTLTDYQAIVRNHLKLSKLWDMGVSNVTKPVIEDFLVEKRENLSVSTVKHIKTVISQSLDRAVGTPGVTANPCKEARLPERKRKNGKKKVNAYNEAEVEKLLDTFQTHEPKHYLMVLFMVRTGCRTSEVAALEWDDINLDNRIVAIQKGFVRGEIVDSTKSEEDRDVDLTPHLVSELRKAKIASGGSGLVFTNAAGNHIDFNLFRRRKYNKMVAKAKLRPSRLHDLRHTYASILLKKCRDILYVQKQLGHSKPSITLDIYSHYLEEDSPTRMVDSLDTPIRTPTAPKTKKELTNVG